jgi:hypothetical protein
MKIRIINQRDEMLWDYTSLVVPDVGDSIHLMEGEQVVSARHFRPLDNEIDIIVYPVMASDSEFEEIDLSKKLPFNVVNLVSLFLSYEHNVDPKPKWTLGQLKSINMTELRKFRGFGPAAERMLQDLIDNPAL